MEIKASNTQQINQNLLKASNNFSQDKSSRSEELSFQERLGEGLRNVAEAQKDAAHIAKSFELGTENDIAKVMVSQQVSSLAFQLTLNVRNKALSAYKDIMNMPV